MYYWLIFIVLFCAVYYFYTFKMLRGKKDAAERFLSEHSDAAKVRLSTGLKGIGYESTQVIAVNGEPPVQFYEGMKQGILLLPGKNVLEVTYSHNRPGILHRNVTTTYEPSSREVEVEPRKIYRLGFDRKEERYVFADVTAEG